MKASRHTRKWRIKHFGRQNQPAAKINLFKQLHESTESAKQLLLFGIESVCPQMDMGGAMERRRVDRFLRPPLPGFC
jgi:hypothetical protein